MLLRFRFPSTWTFLFILIHLLGCGQDRGPTRPDDDPGAGSMHPDPVVELTAKIILHDRILLSWLCPEESPSSSTTAWFQIRRHGVGIDESNWDSAAVAVDALDPAAPGTRQSFWVHGLSPGSEYHFAVRSMDGDGNKSAVAELSATLEQKTTTALELNELWTWSSGDPDAPFEIVSDAVFSNGILHLLDSRRSHIVQMDQQGQHLATFGESGDESGQFRSAVGLDIDAMGDIHVAQAYPAVVISYSTNGSLLEHAAAPGVWPGYLTLSGLRCSPAGFVLSSVSTVPLGTDSYSRQTRVWLRPDDGTGDDLFWEGDAVELTGSTVTEEDLFTLEQRWDLLSDSEVVLAPERDQYLLIGRRLNQTESFRVSRDDSPWPRTDLAFEWADAVLNHPANPVQTLISPTAPMFADIQRLAAGGFAVQTSRDRWDPPQDAMTRYEIYDGTGAFLHQLKIIGAWNGWSDRLIFLNEEFILILTDWWNINRTDADPGQEMRISLCRVNSSSSVPEFQGLSAWINDRVGSRSSPESGGPP